MIQIKFGYIYSFIMLPCEIIVFTISHFFYIIVVESFNCLKAGRLVNARIVEAKKHSLVAEATGQPW